jgi:hypothetical protein
MTTNSEKTKNRGPNRYPLKDHASAKRTIARLTREVLKGDILPEKARAAIYCINSLIQIFKLEEPQKIEAALQCGVKTEMNPEELQKAVDELIPGYEEYLLWAEDKKRREAIERNRIELSPPDQKSLPEPEPEAPLSSISQNLPFQTIHFFQAAIPNIPPVLFYQPLSVCSVRKLDISSFQFAYPQVNTLIANFIVHHTLLSAKL